MKYDDDDKDGKGKNIKKLIVNKVMRMLKEKRMMKKE